MVGFETRPNERSRLNWSLYLILRIGTFAWRTSKTFIISRLFEELSLSIKSPKKKMSLAFESPNFFDRERYLLMSYSAHSIMRSKSESFVSDPNKELPYYRIRYFSTPINELSDCLIRFKASCFNRDLLNDVSALKSCLEIYSSSNDDFIIPPVKFRPSIKLID
jgi:hypothetical protein